MSTLQCLVAMAPLHLSVYDASSPPPPGAGFQLSEPSRAAGVFKAPPAHPLWCDGVGRDVCLQHAFLLHETLLEGCGGVKEMLARSLDGLQAELPSLSRASVVEEVPAVERADLQLLISQPLPWGSDKPDKLRLEVG